MAFMSRGRKPRQALGIADALLVHLHEYVGDRQTRRLALMALIAQHLADEYADEDHDEALKAITDPVLRLAQSYRKAGRKVA